MMDIAGLHDVSQGMAQAGTPAESVRLLQRADNTQHSFVRADIEISMAKIKQWEIALVEQFAVAPFIGSIDDQMNPGDPVQQGVITFDAIRDGGQYRVVYVPGSTQEDSPDQKLQKIAVLRQMGLFGDPADPSTNALVVKMLQLPETSTILEHLANQQAKQEEQQQMMMEMQQQQMEMQQQQQQQPQFDPEAEQMKTEAEIAKQEAKSQARIREIDAQSQAKRQDYAAQKIADIQHALVTESIRPPDMQEKPRPASKKQ
jgi:glutathione S-transferase